MRVARYRLKTMVLTSAAVITLASCGSGSDAGGTGDGSTYTLHTVSPLTGANADIGTAVIAGFKTYFATHGKEVTGKDVTIETIDDKSTAAGTQAAFRQVVSENANLLIGHQNGLALAAAAPILDSAKVPYITTTIADSLIRPEPKPWFYSIRTTTPDEVDIMLRYLEQKLGGSLSGKRIAVVPVDTGASPKEIADLVTAAGKEKEFTVTVEHADAQVSNFDSGAATIESFRPDGVILATTPAVTPVIAKAIIGAGYTGPMIGYSASATLAPPASAELLAAAKETGQEEFATNTFYVQAYVVASIAARAIAECGADCPPEKMIEAIDGIGSFTPEDGSSYGPVDVTGDHLAAENVQFVKYDPATKQLVPSGEPVSVS
ncbi:ABC transporter substrate-binding protein [Actinophytocola sp.]|uniref:ABC transporter substrate-binding protein n=1 Tax=Actinophytocola sp. TaxID=1872138 RepID=UPI003D6BD6E9